MRIVRVHSFTAYIEYDPDTKFYVGTVPPLPGAHTQGATLDELQHNLEEVVALCLEEMGGDDLGPDTFVGTQKVAVSV